MTPHAKVLARTYTEGKNTMLKIAIIDDEEIFLQKTHDAILKILKDSDIRIDRFQSGTALNLARVKTEYDLYFFDIEIGAENGIELAKAVRQTSQYAEIIFVTSHDEYALDGYGAFPLGYLMKPLDLAKLEKLLHIVVEKSTAPSTFVEITEDYRKRMIPVGEIIAIEKRNRKTWVHMYSKDIYETRESLKSVYAKIDTEKLFLFIDRNAAIRINLVATIVPGTAASEKTKVKMRNGSTFEGSEEGIRFLKRVIARGR